MELKNIFSERLKKLRHNKKMTQIEMAEKIGVTPATLSAYETGVKSPSLSVAYDIATKNNASLDWLCGIESEGMSFDNNNEELQKELEKFLYSLSYLMKIGLISINKDENKKDNTISFFSRDSVLGELMDGIYNIIQLNKNNNIKDKVYLNALKGVIDGSKDCIFIGDDPIEYSYLKKQNQ